MLMVLHQIPFPPQACPTDQCNKKLIDQGNGLHRCEKCSQEFPNFKWRMILQANVADHSENVWATCFQVIYSSLLTETYLHIL